MGEIGVFIYLFIYILQLRIVNLAENSGRKWQTGFVREPENDISYWIAAVVMPVGDCPNAVLFLLHRYLTFFFVFLLAFKRVSGRD